MNRQEVLSDPALRDLPYKIELNECGQVVMSPASSHHSILQGLVMVALRKARQDGLVFPECPIQTSEGVKVPGIVWISDAMLREQRNETPYSKAPELCIEVITPSNSVREMDAKRALYLARGAQEVWLCDEQGTLSFHECTGQIQTSQLFPSIGRTESEYLH